MPSANEDKEKLFVGITGTREGITQKQLSTLTNVYNWINDNVGVFIIIHGDCVGADDKANDVFLKLFPQRKFILFPPKNRMLRAHSNIKFPENVILMDEMEYLERNKQIVDISDILIVLPKEEKNEGIKSGTWFTVRYARIQKQTIIIIRPSGLVETIKNE